MSARKCVKVLLITCLLVLGLLSCNGGGNDITKIPQQYQGTWNLHEHFEGELTCDGETQPFEMDLDYTVTVGPSNISDNRGSYIWNWDGDDIIVDFSFVMEMGLDPDCGMMTYTYDYNYLVHFTSSNNANITGTNIFSMVDECMNCSGVINLTGTWTRQ